MDLTELQQKAIAEAKSRLVGEPWCRGICTIGLPTDNELVEDFEGCVQTLMLETAMLDDPNFWRKS